MRTNDLVVAETRPGGRWQKVGLDFIPNEDFAPG
jgi:hypothetical protein